MPEPPPAPGGGSGLDPRWATGSVDFAQKHAAAEQARRNDRRRARTHRLGRLFALTALAGAAVVGVSLAPPGWLPWHHGPSTSSGPTYARHGDAVVVPAGFPVNHLSVPNRDGYAPIEKSGVDTAGFVFIPENVQHVGVYAYAGGLDGRSGDVVIFGHVNMRGQGVGYLGDADHLRPGSIVVTRGAKTPQAWEVTSVRSYPKSKGLPQSIFRATGTRQLTLITCGGKLNTRTHSYYDNIVVTARPMATVVRAA